MNELEFVIYIQMLFGMCVVFPALVVAPCWIIAERRNISPVWWHWVIPLWNWYIAYSLIGGSKKWGVISMALVGIGYSLPQEDVPSILCGTLLVAGICIGCRQIFVFFREWGIVAGAHSRLLPYAFVTLLVAHVLVVVFFVQKSLERLDFTMVINGTNIILWLLFLYIALKTQNNDQCVLSAIEDEFVLSKE